MKILVICQYYKPEPFRISDICEELVRRGHEVTVITGVPNYPLGKIYDEYNNGKKRNEMINGVKVHRCFTIARRQGIIFRLLNYYSYMFSSMRYVKKLSDDYDVVFVNQLSPVMMTNAGVKYKKKYCVPLVMYCLDLWPESLLSIGIRKGSLIYNFFHKVSKKIYKQADKIFTTSKSFSDYFEKEFNITGIEYLPQYAEILFTSEQCCKKTNDYIDLMFAGNIGVAQNVEIIIEAAILTADIPNLRWHIVGDGSEYKKMKAKAEGIENIIFYGRKSLEEMPQLYAMADAMLVTMQKNYVLSLTLPGKVQTYMAAGKPIIGAVEGETNFIVVEANCGICAEPGNAESLAKCVRKFIDMDKDMMGRNAKEYYDKHFQKDMFIDKLEKEFNLIRNIYDCSEFCSSRAINK